MDYTLEFFKGKKRRQRNQWFWQIRAENGRVLADGGEGYGNLEDAEAFPMKVVGALRHLGYHVKTVWPTGVQG